MSASPPDPTPAASSADASAWPEDERDRLFANSLDLLCVAGLDGWFRQVNPSWTRVLGWSRAELLSRPVADFMHPEDRERTLAARARLAEGEPVVGLENRYLCKDGSHRWLAWHSSIDRATGTVFAVARDITDRRRADSERRLRDKLASAGLVAGGITHDFNNLLAAILLNLEMVGVCGPVSTKQEHHLAQARLGIDSARQLIRRLSLLSDETPPARRPLDLAPLLREALHETPGPADARRELLCPPGLPPIDADAEQIRQVLRGLVANALEASPPGGLVRLSAGPAASSALETDGPRPTSYPNKNYIDIVVSDEGPGIPPDRLARVFEPYFTTKARGAQKGMGLSLALCHLIALHHGGAIVVESPPEGGAIARLRLPVAAAAESAPPAGRADVAR